MVFILNSEKPYSFKPTEDESSSSESSSSSEDSYSFKPSEDESSSSSNHDSSTDENYNFGYSCGCKNYSYGDGNKKYYIKSIADMLYFSIGISVIAFIIMLLSTIKFFKFDYFTYLDDKNNRSINWAKIGYGCAISFVVSCVLCMIFCEKIKILRE